MEEEKNTFILLYPKKLIDLVMNDVTVAGSSSLERRQVPSKGVMQPQCRSVVSHSLYKQASQPRDCTGTLS